MKYETPFMEIVAISTDSAVAYEVFEDFANLISKMPQG